VTPAVAFPCSASFGDPERPSRVRFAGTPPLTAAPGPTGQLRAGKSNPMKTDFFPSFQAFGCEFVSTMLPV
jgi:hypothetical protein